MLSAIIYNQITDSELANELHSSNSFKFFTFSQIFIPEREISDEGIISKNGYMSFTISSPDDFLLKNIIQGSLDQTEINFIGQKWLIERMELFDNPDFSNKMKFKTLSPVTVKIKKEIDGKLKTFDLAPGEEFFHQLEKNLIKKYCKFNNLENTDKEIKISSESGEYKNKRIRIGNGSQTTYHRAYMMDFILEGDVDLIKFAYDCGLGEKNSMGFGMLRMME